MSLLMRANETPRTSSVLDDDACWTAVKRRERAADGTFFYSVRTTGVYCRPSCAARLPRRENVAFHKTCADAERAGFRPCKRCRPNEPALAEAHAAAVARACRLIEEAEEAPGLDALAGLEHRFDRFRPEGLRHRHQGDASGIAPRIGASLRDLPPHASEAGRDVVGLRLRHFIPVVDHRAPFMA